MSTCSTCGNTYARSFEVRPATGGSLTFDCFECAIQRLAPLCANCGIRVIGHGVETAEGAVFCCAHCARKRGHSELVDAAEEGADAMHSRAH